MDTALVAVARGVLAHQGGWDEILLVGGPLVVFAGLLWLAKRRAEKLVALREAADRAPADDPGSTRG